ncbi:MAG TPA: LytTR family DNA-binding domain-containing protein [Candidatus Paceibacterota bacterium]|nr:LytTR family DNA-binding domain-containing protein [Candidatus Paceibacterota bacterium]
MTAAALPAPTVLLTDPIPETRIPDQKKIRTLIVDDQVIEREVMTRLLKSEPDIEIVGISVNGREAVEAIQRLQPDLVFLDVQMPELDGFGVVSQLNPARMPVIVFATSNEEFARKAFDVQALDYLIKPCQRERLKVALQRVRRQIQIKRNAGNQPVPSSSEPKSLLLPGGRLAVKTPERILFLKLADITWVEAVNNCVKLHVGGEVHPLCETMAEMESRLPAEQFIRISPVAMVNVEQIRELQPIADGEYMVVVYRGDRLTLTRHYRESLQQLGV